MAAALIAKLQAEDPFLEWPTHAVGWVPDDVQSFYDSCGMWTPAEEQPEPQACSEPQEQGVPRDGEPGDAADSCTRPGHSGVAKRQLPPANRRLTHDEIERHSAALRGYTEHGAGATADGVICSLHASWAACVADPSLRGHLLPLLFAIAKRPNTGPVRAPRTHAEPSCAIYCCLAKQPAD